MFFEERRTGLKNQTNKRMTLQPEMISGVFFFNRYHGQPRIKIFVPKEGSFFFCIQVY